MIVKFIAVPFMGRMIKVFKMAIAKISTTLNSLITTA
jgi:hypothetical protein